MSARVSEMIATPIAAAILVAACGGSTEPRALPRSVSIVAERSASDTIGAALGAPVTVDVRDPATGDARAGASVRFVAVHDDPHRDELILPNGSPLDSTTVATDAVGRATLALRLGVRAGVHRLVARVDGPAGADTATFNVQAGQPASLVLAPRDTAVTLGERFAVATALVDRGGNSTPGIVSYASSSPVSCPIDPVGVVRALTAANCTITATAGVVTATATATLLPNASLLVMRGATLGTLALDGSGFSAIADIDPLAGVGRFRWSASGKEVAFTQRANGVTRVGVLGFDARTRFLPALPIDVARARVSGDEAWVVGITAVTPATLTAAIWRLSADGTASFALCAACDFSTSFVEISNDGRWVIYGDQSRVELVDAATGHDSPLGPETLRARFSADASRFAYVSASTGELRVRNTDASGDRRVAGGLDSITFGSVVNWSPDGQWIVASIGSRYYVVGATTGLALPLPTSIGGVYAVFDGWRP
ncbi:MAG TPA: hypothetical protein VN600_01705 [Gemmatimonadaceae bacterium]|nr:hypothetical protein [Gemmatimonadaceae bacterium]